ncbi:hypothetical protein [uncultured Rikenella sp.]|uniref:hypothetical protein n=1 Tax=uncultured Rikenella sp. TaxID=368003 RepID=UPI00260F1525|nr:hypothetical protein [uncultured Rikenella sp.]
MENNEKRQPQGRTCDGGITEEQINKWKATLGRVIRIDVTDGDDLHVAYFKRPSIETMSAVTKVGKNDEVKSAAVLYDNCFLGGDTEIREDALLFMAATAQLGKLFNSCLGSLKNL